ncbi:hypothetical protein ABDD95_00290 [Mucilaginibacter sp. PAMB04274]|uniref:hypothetical protein n=1 Tax=Mucilaginibacter sp. PAMB04274 TaxID=3138568 RepID=UPI0031F6F879
MGYPVVIAPFLKVDGMALFPFILVKSQRLKQDQVLIRHETIHLKQALELLIIPFYMLYLVNYLINRFKYPGHQQAYEQIIFEREAYRNERNIHYLKNRPFCAWLRYMNK